MDWTLSHVPQQYLLTGLGIVPLLIALIWVLVEEVARFRRPQADHEESD